MLAAGAWYWQGQSTPWLGVVRVVACKVLHGFVIRCNLGGGGRHDHVQNPGLLWDTCNSRNRNLVCKLPLEGGRVGDKHKQVLLAHNSPTID